jgi:SAM-dependent methyltransferase
MVFETRRMGAGFLSDMQDDCCRWCCLVQLVFFLVVIFMAGGFAVLEGMMTGVFQTESSDMKAEVQLLAQHMGLLPGMSLCEMGSANGAMLSRLGAKVMPGGRLFATAPVGAELEATTRAVAQAGMGASLRTFQATDLEWAPGLPPASCDVIFSRMVYHMIPQEVILRYIPQWRMALKPGGRLLVTDHNPANGDNDGPRQPLLVFLGVKTMTVVPQGTEVSEITGGGFELREGPFDHPFYVGGYAAVYGHPVHASTPELAGQAQEGADAQATHAGAELNE